MWWLYMEFLFIWRAFSLYYTFYRLFYVPFIHIVIVQLYTNVLYITCVAVLLILRVSFFTLNSDSPEDLPHLSDMWACWWWIFFSDCPASLTPSTAKLMEKKTSKHEQNDAKTWGCVWVIYGDESAFGVKVHADALHTVSTPPAPRVRTYTQALSQFSSL